MSNTRQKLEEAKYFLSQMQANIENPKNFAFNLSAFLSAARSVTFVMRSEFARFSGFDGWYKSKQEEMNGDGDFKFFNDMRVVTIHQRTVTPHRKTHITISETISASLTRKVVDKDGNVVSERTSEPKAEKSPEEKVTIKHSWYFEERPDEDLLELCNAYVQKLEKLVDECEKRCL